MHQGWIRTQNGQVPEGISLLRNGLAARRADGEGMWSTHYLALLARASEIAAQNEEALRLLEETMQLVEKTGVRWLAAEFSRHKGEMFQRQGRFNAAEEAFLSALSIAVQQGAKLWELRAAINLARLRREQDRCAEAQATLASVYDWFTEGFDTPDLKNAKSLLDSL